MTQTGANTRKVAVVSGGSRGLGRRLCERLLGQEWRVATFSRTANDFVSQASETAAGDFYWTTANLMEPDTVRRFTRDVQRQFGRIDLLINNAGLLPRQELLLTIPAKQIDTVITSNLTAPIILTQACARTMSVAGGGSILNISSINAIRGFRGVAVYSAAKAGLDGFTRSLARELGPLNIRVNSILPGFFTSDMTADVSSRNRARIRQRTPLDRIADIDEIVDVVDFMISPAASFITGQTLAIDGGITC